MNALVSTTDTISAATLEHVLGTGDISKLSTQQRVEFYKAACRSLNLNPLTRPIRFLTFQGQTQAYFTRDGTDQLRKNNKLSLNVVDKHTEEGVYVVTVRAKSPDGREDEDIGAVPIATLKGDALANAYMKCLTKAKRRVTLSFCGLGWSSEDELDTMHGARTFDHDAEIEPAKAEPTSRQQINAEIPLGSFAQTKMAAIDKHKHLSQSWVGAVCKAFIDATTSEEVEALADEVRQRLQRSTTPETNHHIGAAVQAARKRISAQPKPPIPAEDRLPFPGDDLVDGVPEPSEEEAPAIKGEEYASAG